MKESGGGVQLGQLQPALSQQLCGASLCVMVMGLGLGLWLGLGLPQQLRTALC